MDRRERYLSNPHITLSKKRKQALGITEEVPEPGPALRVDTDEPAVAQEVVKPKRRRKRKIDATQELQ